MLRTMERRRCGACKKNRLLKFFAARNKQAGTYQAWCRDCRSSYDQVRYNSSDEQKRIRRKNDRIRERNAKFICDYLLAHPCVECDESDPLVLDFDHVRGDKRFNVSTAVRNCYSLETISTEIAKCDIRCASCHRRKTAKTFATIKGPYLRSLETGRAEILV